MRLSTSYKSYEWSCPSFAIIPVSDVLSLAPDPNRAEELWCLDCETPRRFVRAL